MLLLLVGVTAQPAAATRFRVLNNNDSGPNSLRQAIDDANADDNTPHDIVFRGVDPTDEIDPDPGVEGTIQLSAPLPLDIEKTLTIDGTTGRDLVISGNETDLLLRIAMGVNARVIDTALQNGGIEIGSTAALAIEVGTDLEQTLSDVISGDGDFEKDGAGVLTLLGENTYGGRTTVSAGTLIGNSESLQGDIVNNAALVFDQTDTVGPGEYAGDISGIGAVTKTGAEVLTLSGNNSYTGSTDVQEGTLIGDTDSIPGNVAISSGASLVLDQATEAEASGDISGQGSLEKRGAGELTLLGSNSYSGTTQITEGNLIGSSSSIPGDVEINNALSVLIFDQTDAPGEHTGVISGPGSLVKDGSETLTLTGINSYDGDTTIRQVVDVLGNTLPNRLAAKTFSIPGDVSVELGGQLEFNDSSADGDGTYGGAITGAGAVFKTNDGTVILSGANNYSGGTTISGGRLDVNGSVTGDAQVAANAILGGTGSVGGLVTVASLGTIAPGSPATGNPIDTLQVDSIDLLSDATLRIDVEEDVLGNITADRLLVTNEATIAADSTVEITLGPGSYASVLPVTILTQSALAPPLVVPDLTPDFAFYDTSLATSAGGSTLQFTIVSNGKTLVDVADTLNQTAVATALEASTGLDDVQSNLNTLTEDGVRTALDAMGGETLTEFATTRLAINDRFERSIRGRVQDLVVGEPEAVWGSAPQRTALLGPGVVRTLPTAAVLALAGPAAHAWEQGSGGWLDGYGIYGNLNGNLNSSDVQYTIGGTSMGIDHRFGPRTLAGAAFGYARSNLDFDTRTGSGTANTYQTALYGGWATPRYQVSTAARFAYQDMDTTRRIAFGAIDDVNTASFSGWDAGARLDASANLFRLRRMTVAPVGGVDYVHLNQDGYTETGSTSGLNLIVPGESLDSIVTNLGARLFGTFALGQGTTMAAELRALWLHEFGDRGRRITASFQGDTTPANTFSVIGAESPRDTALLGFSWTVVTQGNLRVFADYTAAINSDLFENSLAVGVRLVW